jgi:large subunit ribosomal protein L10
MILADYVGMNMKDLDELRRQIREIGGEFHVVKNTLTKIAFESAGLQVPDDFFEGPTAIGFAFEDAPALAKVLSDYARDSEQVQLKGGYLGQEVVTADQIVFLASLPPLPEMRARLLGTLMAPANQLARILAEPARQLAQVIKAYADQDSGAEAA